MGAMGAGVRIDECEVEYEVLSAEEEQRVREREASSSGAGGSDGGADGGADEGLYFGYGLFLEGCRWCPEQHAIVETSARSRVCSSLRLFTTLSQNLFWPMSCAKTA